MQNLRSRLERAGGSAKSIPEFAGCCGFFAFSAFMSQSSFLTTALLSQPKPIRVRPQAPMRRQSSRKPHSKGAERHGKHLFQCRAYAPAGHRPGRDAHHRSLPCGFSSSNVCGKFPGSSKNLLGDIFSRNGCNPSTSINPSLCRMSPLLGVCQSHSLV